nr:RagB/SusD family nutrient uptake outer membrane protein [uncultured Bacteroides sp.]
MKKRIIINTFAFLGLLTGFASCSSDDLETSPTDSVSGNVIFSSVQGGEVAMNGIYRATYTSGWSDGNTHQNFGNMSTALFADLMGDDMVQNEMGSGWFYYDYNHSARTRYTSKNWRSYATWNYYYTLISNVNYILAKESTLSGLAEQKANLFAQAYAMRAFCYFNLIQLFQQTYVGHEQSPGVPLYTEPTEATTEGKGRGTVEDVYTQINSDINKAIELFKEAEKGGVSQKAISNIDLYVSYGIKAKVALVQNKWADAAEAAKLALTKPNLTLASASDLSKGMNSTAISSVLWGAKIIADQSTSYASFFSHMDPTTVSMYGAKSRKCISAWLYKQLPVTDFRHDNWWNGKLTTNEATGPNFSYCQKKFLFSDLKTYTGDYIYMRAEEMLLIEAEAEARNGHPSIARNLMKTFGEIRDTKYATRLAAVSDATTLTLDENGTGTAPVITTLLDEIILQRRIELWGECGRIFDILRLKTGFNRNYTGTNHTVKLVGTDTAKPDWKAFILTIPQTEFDGNVNLDATKDQNPI